MCSLRGERRWSACGKASADCGRPSADEDPKMRGAGFIPALVAVGGAPSPSEQMNNSKRGNARH